MNFDFDKDLDYGQWGESVMIDYIEDMLTTDNRLCIFTGSSSGSKLKDYDLSFDLLNDVTKTVTYEVKTDAEGNTGNLFFERKCSGKWSGYMSSKSDYFVYFLPRRLKNNLYIIKTDVLRHILETTFLNCIYYGAGQGGRVVGLLIRTEDFDKEFVNYGGMLKSVNVDIPSRYNLSRF